MKRTYIVLLMTVAAAGLLLIAVSTMDGQEISQAAPMRQTDEGEPNDTIDQAKSLGMPDTVIGHAENQPITATDYFSIPTTLGTNYRATLNIGGAGILYLKLILYDTNKGFYASSSSSSSYAELSWTAWGSTYYIEVKPSGPSTTTLLTADYALDLYQMANTPTPSPTPTPTRTPTPTNTPPPTGDSYEANESFGTAKNMPVAMPTTLELTFHTTTDQDWFKFQAKNGKRYRATTSELNGVDTVLEIYNNSNSKIKENDDYSAGYASQVEWNATYNDFYYIRVWNKASSTGSYNLTLEEVTTSTETPTPTKTPVPGPTAIPGADQFEPNNNFDQAATLGTDITYSANFIPWGGGGGTDNDYYKIWVKPRLHFTCKTSDLAAGVDPNIIVYDNNRNGIGGNDDIALGDYNSSFSYFSTYEGWLYILVGCGTRLPASEVTNSSYKIACEKEMPGATNTPAPTSTPRPAATQAPQQSPIPTPTPSGELTVRPLTTPTPVPVGTPASRFIPIDLLVYYDANNDGQPGAAEGIAGISAQAYEATTDELLAQGFTDEQGSWKPAIAAQGPVRVRVPFFGFTQLVAGEGASIYLRIPPQSLPGGTP